MIEAVINKRKENYFISYIYLYIFLMPWNFLNGQMGGLSVILLIWWLIIAKNRGFFSKLKAIFYFKPLLMILLFFAYSYFSLLWTDNFEDAKKALTYYKYYWIIVPVLFTALNAEQARNGLHIFVISLGIYAIFSILIHLDLIHIIDHTTNPTGVKNPRGILAYAITTPLMAIGFLSSVFIAYYNKLKIIKTVFLIIAVLCLIGIFINNGRAGQLSFFITIGVLLILYRKHLTNPKILFSFIIVIFASWYMLVSFNKLARFQTGINDLKNLEKTNFSGSWGARLYVWYAAADILKKNPIFGVGVGDHIDEFVKYTKTHPSKGAWVRTFHNQHLDILARYGIVGYLLLLGSVISLLYALKTQALYFSLGTVFFSITYFDGFGDIILLMKPYNNIFMLMFILLSVIASTKIALKNKKI
ncbi:O-antigen ligase family protein [Candidatus Sulfurimonas marisnigri]|uniref:O-antigen ligase family protein n=1 Tax=Candidatus Sulfurimonas marisnigri TaxID=2740405 RepID=A0A7S7M1A1_9BACT|nr:O-antigen ligase family protein [Candidatus Sulfurimonas marisnigri]QOY55231.1 O-antigen ligase family protein [Candidatus Sulfurimonas marisnigri]